MIISYDYGHMKGGEDGAAVGILDEYKVVREYGAVVIKYLQQAGHTCLNCTPPDNSGMTLMQSLQYRVNKANTSGSNLHLSFHANCYNGQAHGAEIEVASDTGEKKAKPVLNKICSLGFTNRGIKRPNLYVTRNTTAVCLLFEPFFIDNKDDCKRYNPQTLGKAMAEGILGYDIQEVNVVDVNQAIKILVEKGIISTPEYWQNAVKVVKYLDSLLINVANRIK